MFKRVQDIGVTRRPLVTVFDPITTQMVHYVVDSGGVIVKIAGDDLALTMD